MTPYYQDKYATIYHGDCLELLPEMPEVDLVLTDPPYAEETHRGARTHRGTHRGTRNSKMKKLVHFDSFTVDKVREVFELIKLSGWLISTVDWRHCLPLEMSPPKNMRFVRFGIWNKKNCTPQFSGDRPATGWEAVLILHSIGGRMRWNGGGRRAVFTHGRPVKPLHETQKPVSLYIELIQLFGGELILDPFFGSGTSLVAAKRLNKKSIGIELDESNCEIAAERLSQGVLELGV